MWTLGTSKVSGSYSRLILYWIWHGLLGWGMKSSMNEFCSVGDDSCLFLWDARSGHEPIIKVITLTLNRKAHVVYLYGIHNDLYKPSSVIETICYLFYVIKSIFLTRPFKEMPRTGSWSLKLQFLTL